MAIAPGSQGLLELTDKMIDAGVNLSDDSAVRNYMNENKYTDEDYNALQQGIDDIAQGKRDTDFRPISATNRQLAESLEETPFEEQSFFERFLTGRLAENLMMEQGARLGIAAGAKGVKDVASIPVRPISAIGEAVAPETTQKVKGALKEATDYVDSKIQSTPTGRKISYAVKELADPALTPEEETAVEIASTLVPLGIVNKMTKSLGVAEGKGKRLLDFVLFDYAIKNESDHQFSEVITAVIPATEPLLERLVIDENDTEAERELKKIVDSGLTAGLFEGIFGAIGLTAKGIGEVVDRSQRKKIIDEIVNTAKEGSKERVRRAEAVAIDRVDEPIVTGATAKEVAEGAPVPIKTEVTELGDQYVQKGVISRVLGAPAAALNKIPGIDRINTAIARGLKTTGQLPERLVPAFRAREEAYKSDLREIKVTTNILRQDLKRAKAQAKASGQTADEITENTRIALSGGGDDIQKIEFKINSLAQEESKKQAKKILSEGTRAKNKGATTKAQRSEIDKQVATRIEQQNAALKDNVNRALRGDTDAFLKLPKNIQKSITEAQGMIGAGERALAKLPQYLQESIRYTKRLINKKDAAVKQIYGVKNTDDFVIGLADDGTTYLTRAYEIFTNPKWADALRAGIAARSAKLAGIKPTRKQQKIASKNTPEINEIIDNAFTNLKNKNPDVDEQILWKTLDDFANIGGKPEERGLIFEALSGSRHSQGDTAIKVMAEKNKGLNEPILAFLGEIKDPLRAADITLRNQSKAIALGEYAKEVESFILSNEGKEIALGGFFEGLNKVSTRFLRPSEQIAARAEKTPVGEYLGGVASSIGTRVPSIMPRTADFTTSKQMAQILERGTEMVMHHNVTGTLFGRAIASLQRVAAYGQSTQTTLDIQQHWNNIWGMTQALWTGGFLANPKQFVKFAKQAKAEMISATKSERKLRDAISKSKLNPDVVDAALLGNQEALALLPQNVRKIVNDAAELRYNMRLQRDGILDNSVVATPIKNVTLDRWGDPITMDGWLGAMGKYAKKPLRFAQAAYGFTDDFGKKIAHKVEMEELAQIYPNKTYDEIFKIASDNVLATLPSYSHAAPLIRELGKYPVGAYPVYTAERVRNNLNILKLSLRELREAHLTGNTLLKRKAGKRIAAISAAYAGKEAYRKTQEIENGWTEENIRGLKVLLPSWQQGSIQLPTEPFYLDEDSHVKTRFVDGSTLDADSYIRQPAARLYALAQDYKEGELTETELDELQKGIITDLTAQYYALKGVYGAGKAFVAGEDEYGRPIRRGIDFEDDFMGTLAAFGKVLEPGTSQNIRRYMEAVAAEEALGPGQGKTKSGFPLRQKEMLLFLITGIRNNTFDVDVALSQKVKEAYRNNITAAESFYSEIKDIPIRKRTEEEKAELYNNVAESFRKYQNKVVEHNKKLFDIGKAVSDIEYVINRGTKKEATEKFDTLSSIFTMAADGVINDNLADYAAGVINGLNSPLNFSQDSAMSEIIKFDENTVDSEIMEMLANITAEYQGVELDADK